MAERLIDAEAFLQAEINRCGCVPLVGTYTMNNEYLSERLKNAPTIEAKPIVHAHWEEIANGFMVCSHCKESVEENRKYSYCPICGAQMDELVSNTDELKCSVKIPVISMEDVPKIMEEKE